MPQRHTAHLRRRVSTGIAALVVAGLGTTMPTAMAAPGGTPGPPGNTSKAPASTTQAPAKTQAPAATQPPPAPAPARIVPAVLTMQTWVAGDKVMATGTLLSGSTRAPLAGQTVTYLIDGAPKATGVVDAAGNWQVTVDLEQVEDGNHTIAANFAGTEKDGGAQVQVGMVTRKPPSPSVLTGSLSTAVAGPGDQVKAQGTLKAKDQPIAGATIRFEFGGVTSQGTTNPDGTYSISAAVPANASNGQTLMGILTYPGDAQHPGTSMNLPLMVQKSSPSASPSPSASASPSATPSSSPTASAAAAPASKSPTARKTQSPSSGFNSLAFGAILPFLLLGLVATLAAAGVGYYLYTHRDDPDVG